MILRDKITIRGEELPAQVGYSAGEMGQNNGPGFYLIEKLQAICPARYNIVLRTEVKWRGERYTVIEPPKYRRRGSSDHHMTLTLQRITS